MICVIDCGTSWLGALKDSIVELKKECKIIKEEEINDARIGSFSGIIITGAPTLLTQIDQKAYADLFSFLKTTDIPVLGICNGHQVMGLVYGSKIDIGTKVEKEEQIEIVNRNELFSGVENNSLFREEHTEFITLPKDFVLLAKSATCANEAMRHRRKRLYGTQFHPEVSGENGKKLLRNFLKMCA